ncbi:MAG: ABC transporter permease [Acidobacteriota bacterium]
MHALAYCIREAVGSLWRQRGSAALSVLTIAVAMLVLGAFLLVTSNLDRLMSRWSSAAEFSVYLHDDIGQDQRIALNLMLADSPLVASREYVSKADALARFTRDFPDLAAGADALDENPLPASIEVRLRSGVASADSIEALAARVSAAPGVADVRFDRTWLERLGAIVRGTRWIGWALGAVLILAAVLTVSTIVRLSLHVRRDEVGIMQLMGAPMGLLRGPLVAEGVLHGGAGAILALALLYVGYVAARARFDPVLADIVDPALVAFLPWEFAVALVVGGMVVGCAGGMVAARFVRWAR